MNAHVAPCTGTKSHVSSASLRPSSIYAALGRRALLRTPLSAGEFARAAARRSANATNTRATSQASAFVSSQQESLWKAFASKASGEWECVTATFSGDGSPQQLPERYVPGAFREWGVELYDWQSQCSMLASPEDGTLTYRVRRMMPTVGCEADAVAFTEESQALWAASETSSPGLQARTVLDDGSYFAGPTSIPEDSNSAKLEFCLALPGTSPACRLRLTAVLVKHWQTKRWAATRYEVHSERFEAAYQNGMDLTGCGGGMTGFAKAQATSEQDAGAAGWRTTAGQQYSAETAGVPAAWSQEKSAQLEGDVAVALLPLGLFVKVTTPATAGPGADFLVEVGAVLPEGQRRVAKAGYQGSQLSSFAVTSEQQA